MTVTAWLLFCATETVLCLSPGPSALLVVSLSLTRGRRAGALASLGVIAANAVYFAISASGLVALHALSAEVFDTIKWAGAGYLVFLGARMIARSFAAETEAPAARPAPSSRRSIWQGFVAQGANPNLLFYFAAILPQFVDTSKSLPGQVAILAVSSFAIELTVLSVYSAIAARVGRFAAARTRVAAERVGGGLLVAAGAGLATLRRS